MQLAPTVNGLFVEGEPFNGQEGTPVTAPWLNGIQAEIAAPIMAAGVAINPERSDQLLTALRILFAPVANTTQAAGDASTKTATDQFVQTAISGLAVVNISGNGDKVLTPAQWGVGILVFNGALTGPVNVIVPASPDRWIVFNRATGNKVSVKTLAGAGVVVRPDTAYELICDGVDVFSIAGGGAGSKGRNYFMITA